MPLQPCVESNSRERTRVTGLLSFLECISTLPLSRQVFVSNLVARTIWIPATNLVEKGALEANHFHPYEGCALPLKLLLQAAFLHRRFDDALSCFSS